MADLTTKQLTAMEKVMQSIVAGDQEKSGEITKVFAEFKKALGAGESVTTDDVDEVLGEVMIDKVDTGAAPAEIPDDPVAPILKALYDQVAPIAKRAGTTEAQLQGVFEKAYTSLLGEMDNVIGEAVEATAIELGAGGQLDFAKAGKKPKEEYEGEDGDGDEDEDDMEKVLKKYGVPTVVAKRVSSLEAEVAALTHDKAMTLFTKRAEAIGEPGMAGDLLLLHETNPELCARIEKSLKGKNALLAKSHAWAGEIGAGDGGATGDGPLSQLNAFAHDLVSKSTASGKRLSFAKAFSAVCEQHPDVYREYQAQVERRINRG